MNVNTSAVFTMCRPGYEGDVAAELTDTLAQHNCYGFAKTQKNSGYVAFELYQSEPFSRVNPFIATHKLIFARQSFSLLCTPQTLPPSQRVEAVIDALQSLETEDDQPITFGQLKVEYPDTEVGKSVAKFAKKFAVPLRQALRKAGYMTKKEHNRLPVLHVFIPDFEHWYMGASLPQNSCIHDNGIHRLKFPPQAPSRSTLKLEEAILDLMTAEQRDEIFREGARAVDLGACPGGWTYQLVSRGMHVEAIDNGAMAESLMQTGQVSYFAADGFKYKPAYGSAQLLVCDMIEKPDRVAKLMTTWLEKGFAQAAIFNLKLPMKKRYETVNELLAQMQSALGQNFHFQCKQLYHNRDEVTVSIMPR